MTGKALVLGGILATLFIVGIIRRAPEWRAADWVRFGLQLAIASGSVVVALRMAGAVNYGTTGSWSAAMRALWAVGIALGMLFGVGIGIQLLLEFAGTGQEDRPLFRGYLVAFTILSFLFGVAVWLQGAFGLPFQQSGAVVLGGFAAWLGVARPEWFRRHLGVVLIEGALEETGTRVLYIGLGIAVIALGLVGPGLWAR